MKVDKVIVIGYSGHAYVLCDIFSSMGIEVIGYCETSKKQFNPYNLSYLGNENDSSVLEKINTTNYFTAIGDNKSRRLINQKIEKYISRKAINAIHANASISSSVKLNNGIMVGDGCVINACSHIMDGVICNTQSVIEHECEIGKYCHIAPGAVICGNVKVGENTFIGARAIVRQGVVIGDNVIVGAGTVILKDVPSNSKVVGNPQKFI